MISLYSGTPGSGKSLHTADTLVHYLSVRRPVIVNFPVDMEKLNRALPFYRRFKNTEDIKQYVRVVDNSELTPQNLALWASEYWGERRVVEDDILLVMDECQLLFNARAWQVNDAKGWISFFTQHRKLGYHIILVAQFDRMIDRQIRSLIEYQYIHRKVGNIGAMGTLFKVVSLGELFVAVKMYYPMNERLGASFFKARKKVYSIYDTYATFDNRLSITGGN